LLGEMKFNNFTKKIASNSPVPGGGSVAAMGAAVAAALTEMVANLTIGKKKYVLEQEEMEKIAGLAEKYREKFSRDMDRDAEAFDSVMEAYKIPKDTEEEKRSNAIQSAAKKAAEVPLEVARDAFELMKWIEIVVEKGNSNAVTDGAVAAMMARTAVLSALYNVKINLCSITDQSFLRKTESEVKQLEEGCQIMERKILAKVKL